MALPTGPSRSFSDLGTLPRAEGIGPRTTAHEPTSTTEGDSGGVLTALAGLARSGGDNVSRELVDIGPLTGT